MPLSSFHFSDVAYIALAVFLLATGYAFYKLAETFGRLSSLIRGTERELLPVISKVGGSVDRVNGQLDKLDQITDSAVDAVDSADSAVRAASFAVKQPVKKITGFAAGLSHGAAAFRVRRDWRDAVRAGKEAAARREADLEEELHRER